jgi:glycosyltransferase involved in cell wall biosynthesis
LGNGARFRQAYDIPSTAFTVLFLGRIDEKKGIPFLLSAAESLLAEVPDLWLVLVGNGDPKLEATLRECISSGPLASRTTWCGFLSGAEKASAYAAADVFVLPSKNENFGITVVEAMHEGLPVIISHEVYLSDEVRAANAGIVCEPSTTSVATALRLAWRERDRLAHMAGHAKELADEHFSAAAVTRELLRLYENATPKPTQPG